MTEETKKIFDAPWSVTDLDYVEDSEGYYICEAETREQANRLARLPELYDALAFVLHEKCNNCYYHGTGHPNAQSLQDYIDKGCLFHHKTCDYQKAWELLKKVRDGK